MHNLTSIKQNSNNGLKDVTLKYLILNNSACVEAALGGNLDDALENFGPGVLLVNFFVVCLIVSI